MLFSKKWLRKCKKILLHFLIHIDVLMLCRKFELIPTENYRVMSILKTNKSSSLLLIIIIIISGGGGNIGRRVTLSSHPSPHHQYHPPASSLLPGRSPQLPSRFRHHGATGYHGDNQQFQSNAAAQRKKEREGERKRIWKGLLENSYEYVDVH